MNARDDAVRAAGQHIAEALMLLFDAASIASELTISAPRKSANWSQLRAEDHVDDPLYLTTTEVAARFRTAPGTVRQWRHSGTGPRGTKFGRRVLYALADVDAWERSQIGMQLRDHDREKRRSKL